MRVPLHPLFTSFFQPIVTPRRLLSFYRQVIINDSAPELHCRIALPVFRVLKPEMGDHGCIALGSLPGVVCGRTNCTVSPRPRLGRDWHLNPNSAMLLPLAKYSRPFFLVPRTHAATHEKSDFFFRCTGPSRAVCPIQYTPFQILSLFSQSRLSVGCTCTD